MKRLPILAALLALALTGCGGYGSGPATPSFPPDKATVTKNLMAYKVTKLGAAAAVSLNGATANITLTKTEFKPSPDHTPLFNIAVLYVTVTGTSSKPFAYDALNFFWLNLSDQKRSVSAAPDESHYRDYPAQRPLNRGTVGLNQTVSGIVILRGPDGDGSSVVAYESGAQADDFDNCWWFI